MIEYIKNAKAYKLQNRHISSRCGHMTQFGESRSSQIGVHDQHKAPVTWPYYVTDYIHTGNL